MHWFIITRLIVQSLVAVVVVTVAAFLVVLGVLCQQWDAVLLGVSLEILGLVAMYLTYRGCLCD